MIITIDGPSGTGKSTIGKLLAEKLHFIYFDTGILYRAISFKILHLKVNFHNIKKVEELLEDFDFSIQVLNRQSRYFVNGEDVTDCLHALEITSIVSEIARESIVREKLKKFQIEAAKRGDTIFIGRDMGTVIFPNADLKFFLTASLQVRAYRRYQELKAQFPYQSFSLKMILDDLSKRDRIDTTRSIAPLKCADDAISIDTSNLTIEQVLKEMQRAYQACQ